MMCHSLPVKTAYEYETWLVLALNISMNHYAVAYYYYCITDSKSLQDYNSTMIRGNYYKFH